MDQGEAKKMNISPLIGDLSMGGISGFACGYFTKKFCKLVAFILGGYTASLLYLASRGAISINYEKIWSMFGGSLSKISSIQMSLAPLGVGFVGGLALGLRQG